MRSLLVIPTCLSGLLLATLTGCDRDAHGVTSTERDAVFWAVEEVATSGEDVLLTHVTALDVDSKGRIYVGDWGNAQVSILSDSARLLRTVGRKGEGPGEFRAVDDLAVLPGDTLEVYDVQLARLTTYPPGADSVLRVTPMIGAAALSPPMRAIRFPGTGRILGIQRRPFSPHDDPRADATRMDVVRILSTEGSVVDDSVLVVPSPEMLVQRGDGSISVSRHPFGREGILKMGPQGNLFYAWTDSAVVEVFSPEGARRRRIVIDHAGPPVTGEDVDRAVGERGPAYRRTLEESAPERWPALRGFTVDDQGRVWMGLAAPWGEPVEWAVTGPEGEYEGSVRLPARAEVRRVVGDRIYAVVEDDMDVPRIVVYRFGSSGDSTEAVASAPEN